LREEIKKKMDKISTALDGFEEGKPLPISVNDIYYLLGCASQLLKDVENLEKAYKRDFMQLNQDVDKFREKWKEARQISVRLDGYIMKYKSIMTHVKKLSWWRKTKGLKLELKSFERLEKKQNKLTLDEPIL